MSFIRPKPMTSPEALEKAAEEILHKVKTVERFFCLWEQVLIEVEWNETQTGSSGGEALP